MKQNWRKPILPNQERLLSANYYFRGEGDETPHATVGDVIVIIEEAPHALFVREGNNLRHEVSFFIFSFSFCHICSRPGAWRFARIPIVGFFLFCFVCFRLDRFSKIRTLRKIFSSVEFLPPLQRCVRLLFTSCFHNRFSWPSWMLS